MTNLKKLGLTALAGSLVATTGYAGALDISGAASVSYVSQDETETTHNPFSMTRDITFSGSGEMDNGMTISYFQLLSAGTFSSSGLTLDMGDAGKATFMNGASGGHGISAYDDKMPTAGEQVWDDTGADHGTPAEGIVNPRADNTIEESLGYAVSMEGFTLSTHASFGDGNGTEYSAVIAVDGLVDGLEVGAGLGNNWTAATTEEDLETYYVKYATGPVTVGAQRSNIDRTAATTDIETTTYGISFAVNENLSVSYGISDTDFEASASDEENEGISASYTAGGATIGFVHNKKDNAVGTANADHETTELKLTFAF